MKKLYALRDKETGELEGLPSRVWPTMVFEHKCQAETDIRVFRDDNRFEVVTFREEPTEPCERCKNLDDLVVLWIDPEKDAINLEDIDPTFCPNCGRSLT